MERNDSYSCRGVSKRRSILPTWCRFTYRKNAKLISTVDPNEFPVIPTRLKV